MKVSERIVSVRRHSIGYVIDGVEYTRNEAVKLARKGSIANANAVDNSRYGSHLVGTNGTTLYDLPTRFSTARRFANKRSK